jgi:NAD(P)-dependent dehydrogenase (short-subunit alcohol dehydrogenase family)
MAGRIAVVTGGNKGIGYAIVKGLAKYEGIKTVILAARSPEKGEEAVAKLAKDEGISNVVFEQLDVADLKNIEDFGKRVLTKYQKVDILVNNAGIGIDFGVSFLNADFNTILQTFQTNTLGPLKLAQIFVPVMKAQNYGRIVNISSGTGQLSDMNGKHIAYRFSKVSLNCLTRVINDEMKDVNILCNTMCPGFVKTDMTGGENSKAKKNTRTRS